MSSSDICYWVKTYTHTPTPTPNKKLIGFGSFEKVNLKLAGGPDPWIPRPATPLITCFLQDWIFYVLEIQIENRVKVC